VASGDEKKDEDPRADTSARLRVLADASRAFATVATDYPRLLDRIARTTADLVGDGCLITLLGADGETLVNVANAHRDPEIAAAYASFVSGLSVTKTTSHTVAASVMRSGQGKLVPEVDPETVAATNDEAIRPLARRLNVHSYVVVPILARSATLGTLSMFRSAPGRSYTPDDLTLLYDLADRAGLAIATARLYDELEQRVRDRTAELEAANKELEAFSYSVAHDLRAPLRAIAGFSQALADDCADRLTGEELTHLDRVRASANRMGKMIDALLYFSRTTRQRVDRSAVDLTALARAIVARLREADPSRAVDVVIAPDLVARADAGLVDLVLSNLLGNAWKFTSKVASPRIELGRERDGDHLFFFVRDNGAGFDPTYAHKLFGVFERLHTEAEFEGTGIGLATVRAIVRRHGGTIRAMGAVNGGATFYFTLADERG
jgi:signal transduction histidine kinase